jgi:predicted nucleic acid-binding protein
MKSEVFLDTAFAIAVTIKSDALHSEAAALARRIRAERIRMVTTQAVVFEIGNALAKARHHSLAVELIEGLRSSSDVELLDVTGTRFEEAYELFRARRDKDWSLTDCLSFVVMHERGIDEALTTDSHFRQAGFRTLLEHARPPL